MSTALLTDRAWPDDLIERAIVEGAGHRLVVGPSVAGDSAQIEALAREHRPAAILTCWSPVSAGAIAACPALRIVARMGVGLDNIDVSAATQAGAWVTNVPDYCIEEVSDHAIALVLGWSRGIARLDAAVKAAAWDPSAARLRRFAALTIGVLGLGRIGRRTAAKARALGARVIGYDPVMTAVEGVDVLTFDEVLAAADAVVLHVPLTAATTHVIDRRALETMKRGAFLVNVSRGPLVDTAALIAALRGGRLSGAGLDVVEGEPHPPSELVARPDVIVTPHVAFSSDVAVAQLRERAAREVVRVLDGAPPNYPCNAPRPVAGEATIVT